MMKRVIVPVLISVIAPSTVVAALGDGKGKGIDAGQRSSQEEPRVRFTRPEDRGEDLRLLSSGELARTLAQCAAAAECRKAAQVLGDRALKGSVHLREEAENREAAADGGDLGAGTELSTADAELVAEAVKENLDLCKSRDPNERSEGRLQIQRLWRLSVPALLENLGASEACVAETAARSLSLMQDEPTVRAILETVKGTDDDRLRSMAELALKGMRYSHTPVIPGRPRLDDEAARMFYDEVAVSALRDIRQK